ncbi:hypothetical protein BgiBS90_028911 [Biomphalaria glabrata]|nr:hypothetical protein BgiBS90_028911 [Biomphalaria glabrata]
MNGPSCKTNGHVTTNLTSTPLTSSSAHLHTLPSIPTNAHNFTFFKHHASPSPILISRITTISLTNFQQPASETVWACPAPQTVSTPSPHDTGSTSSSREIRRQKRLSLGGFSREPDVA